MRSFSITLLLSMTACDSSRPPIDPSDPSDAGAAAMGLQRYQLAFGLEETICLDLSAGRSFGCDLVDDTFDVAFTHRDVVIAHSGASTDVALWEGAFESLEDVPDVSRCPPWQDIAPIPSADAAAGAGLWVGPRDSFYHRLRISRYAVYHGVAVAFSVEHLPPER